MCRYVLPILLAILSAGRPALADEKKEGRRGDSPGATQEAKPARALEGEKFLRAEKAALEFVRANHPELAAVLEPLKAMRPREYQRAILELDQARSNLENVKKHNPKRYELALEAWKARSKAELVAARLSNAPSQELEGQLRTSLEAQLDVELRQQESDREQLEKRLKTLKESIDRLKADRDAVIESRLRVLRNKAQRARRLDAGKSAPEKPSQAREKGEKKA